MKKFKTMTELDILHAAEIMLLDRWTRVYRFLEQSPDNETAKNHMQCYRAMLKELRPEISRLEKIERLRGGQSPEKE